jgi:anti-sigma factor RsiW
MNCRRFQNQLDEYVEGSLSASAQAAVERHLASCDACRRTVQEERQFAQSVSIRLKQDASSLTLGLEIR